MPKFRDRMETSRFLKLVAEARRRYGGPSRFAAPLAERRSEPPGEPPREHRPVEAEAKESQA